MSEAAARAAVEDVRLALEQALAGELRALYLFGSLSRGEYRPGYSDVNLLAVSTHKAGFQKFRAALRPLWNRHGSVLVRCPFYADESTIRRHLRLEPVLSLHLARHRLLLSGADILQDLMGNGSPELLANHAYDLMRASGLLFPARIAEEELLTLERLISRLAGHASKGGSASGQSFEKWFETARRHFERGVAEGTRNGDDSGQSVSGPFEEGAVLAAYEREGWLIVVAHGLDPDNRRKVNEELSSRAMADGLNGVMLVTPLQLRLVLQYEVPADFRLGRFRHVGGRDALADLEVADWRVWRDLGARASRMRIAELPHRYVIATSDMMSKMVHDFQNRLLNIQLRSELLSRITGSQSVTPPNLVPDRSASYAQRIAGLAKQLDWWSDFYLQLMESP